MSEDEERARLLARLDAARVGHLATATPDGKPHVVPICFVVVGETAFSLVDDKPKRTRKGLRRLRNIESNPRVNLIADHFEEDWSRLWFVMVEGEASMVADTADYEAGLTALRRKYPQYRDLDVGPQSHPMIRIGIGRVIGWQGGGGGD